MGPNDMNAKALACETRLCVLGVGYVGKSLLRQFGHTFHCTGFDISERSVQDARHQLKDLSKVALTTDVLELEGATHYLIAVPTPIKKDNSVDLSHVLLAISMVIRFARPGCCIIIESSVPIGTTRKLLGQFKTTYFCGMSPERIDPGRIVPTPKQIPKVVSGLTTRALKEIIAIYSRAYENIVPVTRPEVAEMMKLYENCFRMVNIAYVNEISDVCSSYRIDVNEVIGAASTKPFGFLPFQPGLGVGGHCIPMNCFYLFSGGKPLPILERATQLMLERPWRLATMFYKSCLYHMQRKASFIGHHGPRLLIVGIAFKAGQSEISASPSLSFANGLHYMGCQKLKFFDPLVQQKDLESIEKLPSMHWTPSYIESEFDGIAICMKQKGVNLNIIGDIKDCFIRSFV